MEPFDLERIVIGSTPVGYLLEIVFRTVVLYLYTLGILRLIGQRGMEKLSSFDFAIVIAMGSAVGDPMFYPEVPLLHGMVVVTTILAVERGLGWITKKSSKVERAIEGRTMIAVKDGCIDLGYMENSTLSQGELFMKLRGHGARQLGEVEAAYLELDGSYSVFLHSPVKANPGLPLVPPWDIKAPARFEAGSSAPEDGTYACSRCGKAITQAAGELFETCSRCGGGTWIRAVKTDRTNGMPHASTDGTVDE